MATFSRAKKYRRGSAFAVGAAFLLAIQDPFSAAAAKTVSLVNFIGFTQAALLLSLPLLLWKSSTRVEFWRLTSKAATYPKLAALFLIGVSGLALYNLGLANAHPITVSAVLNLSPFWAALVALVVARKPIPLSIPIFFGCLVVAFAGALMVAWSQSDAGEGSGLGALAQDLFHHSAVLAIPIPALLALNGTLIGKWFAKSDPLAALAANFAFSGILLIPAAALFSYSRSQLHWNPSQVLPVVLLVVGTLTSAALGRALYQIALKTTDNDNGYVTMFFLLMPALSCLVAIPLSQWVAEVHVKFGPAFFGGLVLVAAPLAFFCLKSWRTESAAATPPEPSGEGALAAGEELVRLS